MTAMVNQRVALAFSGSVRSAKWLIWHPIANEFEVEYRDGENNPTNSFTFDTLDDGVSFYNSLGA